MSKRLIYADHAATTQLSETALVAMMPFLREEFGNPSSLHSWAKAPRKAVAEARRIIADCIGAKPEQIYFTSGGTESDNWAIKCVGEGHVVVSAFEHHAVLNACEGLNGVGSGIVYPGEDGIVDAAGYFVRGSGMLGRREVFDIASLMLANNEIGTIQPVGELATKAHKSMHAKWVRINRVHTDAVQAIGNIPVDVNALGVDYLSASAHKFNGPRGIGFLYVRDPLELKPFINGGQQESGMRAGTENVAAIVGMAAALRENVDALDANVKHKRLLADKLRSRISCECPDAHFNGDPERQLPGFVSVSFAGRNAEGIMQILDLKGIAVSTGAACDSRNTQISHVLRAIGLPDDWAKGTLRITLGKENSESDVDAIVEALRLAKAFV